MPERGIPNVVDVMPQPEYVRLLERLQQLAGMSVYQWTYEIGGPQPNFAPETQFFEQAIAYTIVRELAWRVIGTVVPDPVVSIVVPQMLQHLETIRCACDGPAVMERVQTLRPTTVQIIDDMRSWLSRTYL